MIVSSVTPQYNLGAALLERRMASQTSIAVCLEVVRDLRKNKMPARRAEPSHPIWAKFQNAARKVAIVLVL